LGLAIVSSIVKAHDGSVTAESAPGRTVFRVRLPLINEAHETHGAGKH
jgi:two-component system, OmpR family, sensor histidine kinase TrcS